MYDLDDDDVRTAVASELYSNNICVDNTHHKTVTTQSLRALLSARVAHPIHGILASAMLFILIMSSSLVTLFQYLLATLQFATSCLRSTSTHNASHAGHLRRVVGAALCVPASPS